MTDRINGRLALNLLWFSHFPLETLSNTCLVLFLLKTARNAQLKWVTGPQTGIFYLDKVFFTKLEQLLPDYQHKISLSDFSADICVRTSSAPRTFAMRHCKTI